jgi:hypothetical protein
MCGDGPIRMWTHHKLPSFHKFLVDHLASKVLPRFDLDGFLDDSIRPTTERLASAVLMRGVFQKLGILSLVE